MRPFETSNVIAKSISIPSVLGRSAPRFTVMPLYSASNVPDTVRMEASGTASPNPLIFLREVTVRAVMSLPC